jgi:hypothetical protein
MLATIEFDDQPVFDADEIDYETVAWRLAAKMKASRAPRSEVNP